MASWIPAYAGMTGDQASLGERPLQGPLEAFAEVRPPATHPRKTGRSVCCWSTSATPEATDYWSMRRYLEEFLSDRRVIETPRWLWWPILNLVILTRRPRMKGPDYDTIWNKERDESPLR